MKVTRIIIMEGNPDWIRATLAKSWLKPNEPVKFSWHQRIEETARIIERENETQDEYEARKLREGSFDDPK